MEQIGLEVILKDEGFQAGLKAYTDGLNKMQKNTDVAMKAIGVSWDEQSNRWKKGGKYISESGIAEELEKLRAKFQPVTKAAEDAGDAIAKAPTRGASSWREYGNTIDRTGRQSMIGIRAVSEALAAIGVPPGIIDATRSAGNMADTFGDLGGIVADINPIFAGLAIAAAGVAVSIYAFNEASKQNAQVIKDLIQPYEDLYQAVKKLNKERQVEKEIGFSSSALLEFGNSSEKAGKQVEEFLKQVSELEKLKATRQLLIDLAKDGSPAAAWRELVFGIEAAWSDLGAFMEGKTSDKLNLNKLMSDIADAEGRVNQLRTGIHGLGQFGGVQSGDLLKVAQAAQAQYITVYNSSAERIAQIESDLADRRIEINSSAAERIADIQKSLGHTLESMQRDYGKQLASFAKQEIQIKADAGKQIAQIEKDTQKQIAQINKDAAKQLAQIDKDTAKSLAQVNIDEAKSLAQVDSNLQKTLRHARTARERREARLDAADRKKEIADQAAERRADIVEQANERKQQIIEARDERRQQIIEARNERLADIAEQRKERLQALAEQKQAAAEEFEYRKAEAKRAADEQVAQAKRAAAEQIAASQKAADKQTEAINKALADQRAAMENQMRGLAVSMGIGGVTIGQALGNGFVSGLAPLVNAEVKRVMGLINTILAAIRNIQNFNPSSLGAALPGSPASPSPTASASLSRPSVVQPISNSTTSNSRTVNVTVPISGTFNGTSESGIEAIAQHVADRTVAAILNAV